MDNLSMQLPTVSNSVDGAEKCCGRVQEARNRAAVQARMDQIERTVQLKVLGKGFGVQKPTIPSEPLPLPRSACL